MLSNDTDIGEWAKEGFIDLFSAASKGQLAAVKFFVEKQEQSIHAKNDLDQTLLYCAVINGHLNVAQYLIDRGADLKKEKQIDLDFLEDLARKKYFSVVTYLAKEKPIALSTLGEAAAKGYLGLVQYFVGEQNKGIDETPLYKAAVNGHVDVLRYLIKQKAQLALDSDRIPDLLETVAIKGHFTILSDLSEKGNVPLPSLWEAAEKGYLGIIQYLVEVQHKDLHVKDSTGQTLLHIAAFHGHLVLAQYLINHGVNVGGKDNFSYSPLQKAAINGHVDVLRYLLSQGANVDDFDEISEDLLYDTIGEGHLDMLRYLLEERKMGINSSDNFGWKLIEPAAFNNQLAIVKYLLHYQTDWRSNNTRDLDLLNRVALMGHFSVIDCLVAERSISLPTLWRAAEENYLGIAKYLIGEKKIDMHKRDSQGFSPLDYAAYNGHLSLVKYLLSQNTKLEDENNFRYKTVLDLAIQQGHLNIVKYFVEEKKVNLNILNSLGWILLNRAAHSGQLAIVKYLAEKGTGARLNTQNREGDTPHTTVLENYPAIIEYLLENTADPKVKNNFGDAALDLETLINQTPLIQYIVSKKITHNRHTISLQTDHHLPITKANDAIPSGASRPASWINDGWRFLINMPLSLFSSATTALPQWDSANIGKDTTDLKTESTHLDATILLSGVITSKITKKKLGFYKIPSLSEKEVLNVRVQAVNVSVQAALERFPR